MSIRAVGVIFNNAVQTESGCIEYVGRRTDSRKRYSRLCHNGKTVYAHRLIYETFRGPIPEGHYVCHLCDNTRCVNIGHLFAGTPKDNTDDMVRKNRDLLFGPKHPKTKLTRPQVEVIKSRLRAGEMQKVIARDYGVTRSCILQINIGRSWKDVA